MFLYTSIFSSVVHARAKTTKSPINECVCFYICVCVYISLESQTAKSNCSFFLSFFFSIYHLVCADSNRTSTGVFSSLSHYSVMRTLSSDFITRLFKPNRNIQQMINLFFSSFLALFVSLLFFSSIIKRITLRKHIRQ